MQVAIGRLWENSPTYFCLVFECGVLAFQLARLSFPFPFCPRVQNTQCNLRIDRQTDLRFIAPLELKLSRQISRNP